MVLVVLIATATELYRVGAIKSGLRFMFHLTINFVDDLTAGLSLAINFTRTYNIGNQIYFVKIQRLDKSNYSSLQYLMQNTTVTLVNLLI